MKLKGYTQDEIEYGQEMDDNLREACHDVVFNLDGQPFSKAAIRQEAFDNSEYADIDDPPVSILAKRAITEITDELLTHRDAHGYRLFIPLVRSGKFTTGMWQRFPAVTCMDVGEYKGTIKTTINVLKKDVNRLSTIERLHKKLGFALDQPITVAYNKLTS